MLDSFAPGVHERIGFVASLWWQAEAIEMVPEIVTFMTAPVLEERGSPYRLRLPGRATGECADQASKKEKAVSAAHA